VALQGSIDTFALDDVLRLVASTAKSGRLTLRGTRGAGELVVRDGYVLGGSVTTDERISEPHEVVFELLRLDDGEFVFDAVDIDGYQVADPADVDTVLGSAWELLDEWREIEAAIPGIDAVVGLAPEGPDTTVKIDPAQWRMIAVIAAGVPMNELADRLDVSTLDAGRVLRTLVGHGLITVEEIEADIEAEAAAPEVSHAAFTAEPAVWADEPESFNGNGNGTNGINGTNGHGASASNGHVEVDTDILFESVHDATAMSLADPLADHDEAAWGAVSAPPADGAEFAHSLADLSPRAAKAVAAAARASTAEERDAALAELDGTGEEVDHEVLLQLLGPIEG
jgi:hypothetical protein